MNKKITSYQKDLIESLRDPREAAAYLNEALEDGDKEVVILAMSNFDKAHGRIFVTPKKRT